MRPAEVTPEALRHTCLAHLARQGLRMAELARLAGHLGSEQAALYSAYAPEGIRRSLAEIDRTMHGVLNADVVA